jgi:adenosine kinase
LRREFGGCAGNIAYNLKLLGDEPLIMATIGQDGMAYLERLTGLGISTRCIRQIDDAWTAQAFITTDADSNQITAFHPGAMTVSHQLKVADAGAVKFAIVAPDGRAGMLQHAHECAELRVPFIFDPGQGLPMFNGAELIAFIEQASYVAVNDYEGALLTERTGLSIPQIAERVRALVVTRGENGADIHVGSTHHAVPPVPVSQVVDPTGCGDAFRAGMLYGLNHDLDWPTLGRLASLMGSIKIGHQGGQNHAPSAAEIGERFFKAFGYRF